MDTRIGSSPPGVAPASSSKGALRLIEEAGRKYGRAEHFGGDERQVLQRLLSQQGVDSDEWMKKQDEILKRLNRPFAAGYEEEPNDLDSFIRRHRERSIRNMLDEQSARVEKMQEAQRAQAFINAWERDKERVVHSFVAAGSDGVADLVSAWKHSRRSGGGPIAHVLSSGASAPLEIDALADLYAKQVAVYNLAAVRGTRDADLGSALLGALSQSSPSVAALVSPQQLNLWEMTLRMVGALRDVATTSGSSPLLARCEESGERAIVDGALAYLEECARLDALRQMQPGGGGAARCDDAASLMTLVKHFVRLNVGRIARERAVQFEGDAVDGAPIWPCIFYCMRFGALDAAVIMSKRASDALDIHAFMKEYASSSSSSSGARRSLSAQSTQAIRSAYQTDVRFGRDPYRQAVFCLMAKIDPFEAHDEICETSDDFLWLMLAQTDALTPGCGLAAVQARIRHEYRQTRFAGCDDDSNDASSTNDRWLDYVSALLLTAQFEHAIAYLFRHVPSLRRDCVHHAMALAEADALAIVDDNDHHTPLVGGTDDSNDAASALPLLNLPLLVDSYIKDVRMQFPGVAVHTAQTKRSRDTTAVMLPCLACSAKHGD